MVNVYGLLERLVNYSDAAKAVESILNEHQIIDVEKILDLIPRDKIEQYLDSTKSA